MYLNALPASFLFQKINPQTFEGKMDRHNVTEEY